MRYLWPEHKAKQIQETEDRLSKLDEKKTGMHRQG